VAKITGIRSRRLPAHLQARECHPFVGESAQRGFSRLSWKRKKSGEPLRPLV